MRQNKRKYEFKRDKRWRKIRTSIAIILIIAVVLIGVGLGIKNLKNKSNEGKTFNAQIDDSLTTVEYVYGKLNVKANVYSEASETSTLLGTFDYLDEVNIESEELVFGEDGNSYLLVSNMDDDNELKGYVLGLNITLVTIDLNNNLEVLEEHNGADYNQGEYQNDIDTSSLKEMASVKKTSNSNQKCYTSIDTYGSYVDGNIKCDDNARFIGMTYKINDVDYKTLNIDNNSLEFSQSFDKEIKDKANISFKTYYYNDNINQLKYVQTGGKLDKNAECSINLTQSGLKTIIKPGKCEGLEDKTYIESNYFNKLYYNVIKSKGKLSYTLSKTVAGQSKTVKYYGYILDIIPILQKSYKVTVPKCPKGYSYSTDVTKCQKVVKATSKIVCKKGKYDSKTKKCKYVPSVRKYSLTEKEYKGLAKVCQREQGNAKGAAAEASLMANRFELYGKNNGNGTSLYNYVRSGGWWGNNSSTMDNWKSVNKDIAKAVKDVLVNGKRTVPRYVDEHDCIDCGGSFDVVKIVTNGKTITSHSELVKHSNYKQAKTIIYNRYSAKYTFYTFPTKYSDPFGYTSTAYKKVLNSIQYTKPTKSLYCKTGKLQKSNCVITQNAPIKNYKLG